MTDAPLIETPARLRSVALHEEHRIVFNAKAFVGDGVVRTKDNNRSYAMSEEEWDLHVSVLRCWDTGGEGLDKAAYRRTKIAHESGLTRLPRAAPAKN
jgi:hypothetical protein